MEPGTRQQEMPSPALPEPACPGTPHLGYWPGLLRAHVWGCTALVAGCWGYPGGGSRCPPTQVWPRAPLTQLLIFLSQLLIVGVLRLSMPNQGQDFGRHEVLGAQQKSKA